MKNEPELSYMPRVRQDLRRCRRFLRRKTPDRALRRTAEVFKGVRQVRANPLLYPVRTVHPETGAGLRRHNVAQFVIIYAYFNPSPSTPSGEVSIRAIVHASEADVWFGVRESGPCGVLRPLSTRAFISAGLQLSGTAGPAIYTPASQARCGE
jgi:plasmid stabilization system protein ParE